MSLEKWALLLNGEKEIFSSFEDAVKVFRSYIKEYLESDEDMFGSNSGVPFPIGAYFNYKYNKGAITDKEIAVETRLYMLLVSFFYDDVGEGSKQALSSIERSISYQGHIREFNNEIVKVFIDKREDEIVLDLYHYDDDIMYINTNAFLFTKDKNYYYFKSHQIVNTSSNKGKLGKKLDINISIVKGEQL